MENYIVRIYRRDEGLDSVAGVVEVVSKQEQKPFKNHEELLAILKIIEKPRVNIVWESAPPKDV